MVKNHTIKSVIISDMICNFMLKKKNTFVMCEKNQVVRYNAKCLFIKINAYAESMLSWDNFKWFAAINSLLHKPFQGGGVT